MDVGYMKIKQDFGGRRKKCHNIKSKDGQPPVEESIDKGQEYIY